MSVGRDDPATGFFAPLLGDGRPLLFAVAGGLLFGAAATAAGGLAILRVGLGETFVPEDLEFMGVTAAQLRALNPHLVPLLAHDRAGFGGGVLTLGLTTMLCLWCAPLSRHLHQAVTVAGALLAGVAVGYPGTSAVRSTPARSRATT